MKRTIIGLLALLVLGFSGTAHASEVTGQLSSNGATSSGSEVGGTLGGGNTTTGGSSGSLAGTVIGGSSSGSNSNSNRSSGSGGGSTATRTGSVLGASTVSESVPGPVVVARVPSEALRTDTGTGQTVAVSIDEEQQMALEEVDTYDSGQLAAAGAVTGISSLWFWLLPLLLVVLLAVYLLYRSSREENGPRVRR